jgi:hypothetical protein
MGGRHEGREDNTDKDTVKKGRCLQVGQDQTSDGLRC